MRRNAVFLTAALFLAALAAGCNSPTPPPPPIAAPAAPLPEGSGCSPSIARYRAVQENDLAMGHVNKSVYAQIQKEIADAQSACVLGEEAKAQSLLRASKSRHGYPD
jgi:hypothetical protein